MSNKTNIKVLLIDDEEDFLIPTAKALKKRGFKVDTAQSGLKALDKLEHSEFDVIVLDVKMPEMDGLETISLIQSHWVNIEIIMLTGYGNIDTAFKASKGGIFEFLTKPCDIDLLVN